MREELKRTETTEELELTHVTINWHSLLSLDVCQVSSSTILQTSKTHLLLYNYFIRKSTVHEYSCWMDCECALGTSHHSWKNCLSKLCSCCWNKWWVFNSQKLISCNKNWAKFFIVTKKKITKNSEKLNVSLRLRHCFFWGRILDLLPQQQAKEKYSNAKQIVNRPHHILMPGLVNVHTHSPMVRFIGHYLTKNKEIYVFLFIVQTLFRGFADDLNLADWLNTRILPAETKWVSKEFVVYDKWKTLHFVILQTKKFFFHTPFTFVSSIVWCDVFCSVMVHNLQWLKW